MDIKVNVIVDHALLLISVSPIYGFLFLSVGSDIMVAIVVMTVVHFKFL